MGKRYRRAAAEEDQCAVITEQICWVIIITMGIFWCWVAAKGPDNTIIPLKSWWNGDGWTTGGQWEAIGLAHAERYQKDPVYRAKVNGLDSEKKRLEAERDKLEARIARIESSGKKVHEEQLAKRREKLDEKEAAILQREQLLILEPPDMTGESRTAHNQGHGSKPPDKQNVNQTSSKRSRKRMS